MLSTELGSGWSGRRRLEVASVPAKAESDPEELIVVTEKWSYCICGTVSPQGPQGKRLWKAARLAAVLFCF